MIKLDPDLVAAARQGGRVAPEVLVISLQRLEALRGEGAFPSNRNDRSRIPSN